MGRSSITATADTIAKNWSTNMVNSVPKIQEGISRVQENPMAKAAENADKYQAGVIRSVNEGRYQAGLLAVDFQAWKTLTRQKVGERLSGGVTAAMPKMVKFMQWAIPVINAGMQTVNNMPKQNLQDSKNKMLAWVDYMAQNRYKK